MSLLQVKLHLSPATMEHSRSEISEFVRYHIQSFLFSQMLPQKLDICLQASLSPFLFLHSINLSAQGNRKWGPVFTRGKSHTLAELDPKNRKPFSYVYTGNENTHRVRLSEVDMHKPCSDICASSPENASLSFAPEVQKRISNSLAGLL